MQHHLLTFPHLPLLQHYRHMEHIPFHFYVYTAEIPLCNIPHIFKPYPMLRNDSRQDTCFVVGGSGLPLLTGTTPSKLFSTYSIKNCFFRFSCSRSKFLTKLLKTFDKNFPEIFPDFTDTKRRAEPSAFLTVILLITPTLQQELLPRLCTW